MGKTNLAIVFGAALGAILVGGCFKADVEVPSYAGWGRPAPAANIPPANPNDKADLVRENQQLNDRLAYLEEQNRKLSGKSQNQKREMAKIQSQIDDLSRQRDQYKRELGQ